MDGKNIAILDSLRINEQLRFTELLRETEKKVEISRQTFHTRLKFLHREGLISKRKNKYSLNLSKENKKFYKVTSASLTKLERKVEKLPNSSDPFWNGLKMLTYIYNDCYVPSKWVSLCYKHEYSKNDRLHVSQNLNRFERMIDKIIRILYKENRQQAKILLKSNDLTFIEKSKYPNTSKSSLRFS